MALDLGGRGSAGKMIEDLSSAGVHSAPGKPVTQCGERPLEFGPAEEAVVSHAASRSRPDR
jgi:hypothetical protein